MAPPLTIARKRWPPLDQLLSQHTEGCFLSITMRRSTSLASLSSPQRMAKPLIGCRRGELPAQRTQRLVGVNASLTLTILLIVLLVDQRGPELLNNNCSLSLQRMAYLSTGHCICQARFLKLQYRRRIFDLYTKQLDESRKSLKL